MSIPKNYQDLENIIAQMTLSEKVAQLYGLWIALEEDGSGSILELGDDQIPQTVDEVIANGLGQITRPLGARPIEPLAGVKALNAFQSKVISASRFGIPALSHEECLPGLMVKGATLFPSALNYGSCWDPKLLELAASAIGAELLAVGARQGLSPVLDVTRDARWGRVEETFSEDPYHVGIMASAYVRGLQQERTGKRQLLATLKHFAGHSGSEGARNHAPVNIGPRELANTFLLPFEMAMKLANPGSVMPAYHDVDGEPLSSSRHYLNEVLRQQWGFDGILVSDYLAVKLLYSQHRTARNRAEASAAALLAGMDVELPNHTCYFHGAREALEQGLLSMSDIDECVRRNLREKLRLGLFAQPYADEGRVLQVLRRPAHVELAEQLAAESFVLLKNDGVLPLDSSKKQNIALLGQCASDQLSLFCGYSFPVHLLNSGADPNQEHYADTLQEVLGQYLPQAWINYQLGASILRDDIGNGAVFPSEEILQTDIKSVYSDDESQIPAAVAVASQADLVILNLGDRSGLFRRGTVAEGSDASSLKLPGKQEELLRQVLAIGNPCILVLQCGRPYCIPPELLARLKALLLVWLPGERGAHAIAKTLVGQYNPGGRLNVSFPKNVGAVPYFYNHKFKSAGMPIQEDFGAVFPFGYGLSYSEFRYSEFAVAQTEVQSSGSIEVSCCVENISGTAGWEVAQLYARDLHASVVRPKIELKGFQRLHLKAGEKKRLRFQLPVDMLNFSTRIDGRIRRIVEAGKFTLSLGRSAEELVFQQDIEVMGPAQRILACNWRMECMVSVE